jgi:hypothetical protein
MTDEPPPMRQRLAMAPIGEESQKARRLGLADTDLLAQAKSRLELAAIFAQLAQAMSVHRHRRELTEHAKRLELEALRLELAAKVAPRRP